MQKRSYEVILRDGTYVKDILAVSPNEALNQVIKDKGIARVYYHNISDLADASVYLVNSKRSSITHYLFQYENQPDLEGNILQYYAKMHISSYFSKSANIINGFVSFLAKKYDYNRTEVPKLLKKLGFTEEARMIIYKTCFGESHE